MVQRKNYNMSRIIIPLPDQEYTLVQEKAKSMGLTVTAYARNVLLNSFKKDTDKKHQEMKKAIHGLIPVLAEAFGRTQNVPSEHVEKLAKVLLQRYEKEIE